MDCDETGGKRIVFNVALRDRRDRHVDQRSGTIEGKNCVQQRHVFSVLHITLTDQIECDVLSVIVFKQEKLVRIGISVSGWNEVVELLACDLHDHFLELRHLKLAQPGSHRGDTEALAADNDERSRLEALGQGGLQLVELEHVE